MKFHRRQRVVVRAFLFIVSSVSLVAGDLIEVAGMGSATQTSEWNGGLYPAGNAIDGNESTFSHTDVTTRDNHLEVLLDQEYEVARIEVVMRGDCCAGRMTGTVLRGFDEAAGSVFSAEVIDPGIGETLVFDVPEGVMMRRVRFGFEDGGKNPGTDFSMIHLGEIRVWAQEGPRVNIATFEASPREIESGQTVTLSWSVENAEEVKLFPGGQVIAHAGSVVLSPSGSVIYEIEASNGRGASRTMLSVLVDGNAFPVRVNEIMASNAGSLVRGDGSTPDWIELWNPNPFPVDLSGYGLSDDDADPRKFVFPAVQIPADGFLVVDASDGPVDGIVSTGFGLSRDEGERVILSGPEFQILENLILPKQYPDVSYGRTRDGENRYLLRPTPGGINNEDSVGGFVEDTKFSVDRGFYDTPQVVEITTGTPDAEIRVTTDGSEPSPENPGAFLYEGALTISETTVLRAAAFREGWEPTDVDTQTYLFANQVGGQSTTPEDFPLQWVPNLNGVQSPVSSYSHFGMNQGVLASLPLTDLEGEDFELNEALMAIPSISLVLDADVLFDPVDGLHVNARQRGRSWERGVSFEVIDPARGTEVQANCGLRMHGGWNRYPEMLKKSFRLYFRSEYGVSKLRYPMFPGSGIAEFDRLILRSGNGKAWPSPWRALSGTGNSLERVTYLRDQIVRDFQKATGNNAIPGTFMHLYINGQYWGLYNPVERPTEHFAAARYGGDEEEYDVIKWIRGTGHQVAAGNDDAWNELISLVRGNISNEATYAAIRELLDLENFADYMLVNHFAGNIDWIDNNIYAMRRRLPGEQFRFYCWDSEESFLTVGADISDRNVSDTCTEIHMALRGHPEYRQLFADRAYKHLFNEGALTFERTSEVLDLHAGMIDRAVVGESARWGDLLRPADPYGRSDWLAEVVNLKGAYLNQRVGITLNQLKNDGLYPGFDPPVFQPQRGGVVVPGTQVTLEHQSGGTIYYTLDGSDPRNAGGAVSETALEFDDGTETVSVIGRGSDWKYLDNGSDLGASDLVAGAPGFDDSNWKHEGFDDSAWAEGAAPLGYGGIADTTLNTVVSYGDDPFMKHRTTYFRKSFPMTNVQQYVSLNLRVLRDDGVVIYLNGVEVGRTGFPEGTGVVDSATLAEEQAGAVEAILHEFEIPAALLEEGENVTAVELHQARDSSSDLGFDLELTGEIAEEGGRIAITGGTLIKARVLVGGQWSALNEAFYLAGDRATDLLVSELMYHPEDGGAEFLEITNRGETRHLLGDLKISGGIQFDFSTATVSELGPGERLVLVRDAGVFSLVYPGTDFAGDYDGGLGNSGDSFSLEDAEGNVLWTLSYRDDAPWPAGTDGGGRSLVYLGGEAGEATSWRASVDAGGHPGSSDSIPYTEGASLAAYALGGQAFSIGAGDEILFEVVINPGADDALVMPEQSSDLQNWSAEGLILLGQEPTASGAMKQTWRLDRREREFLRVRLERR